MFVCYFFFQFKKLEPVIKIQTLEKGVIHLKNITLFPKKKEVAKTKKIGFYSFKSISTVTNYTIYLNPAICTIKYGDELKQHVFIVTVNCEWTQSATGEQTHGERVERVEYVSAMWTQVPLELF